MPKPPLDSAHGQLRQVLAGLRNSRLSDEELLMRFLAEREESAFAALVKRHGPMVLSVCQSVLHHTQDAEDVCQATFLLLARKAAGIRNKSSLASWLHGVALRLARKLKSSKSRGAEQPRPGQPPADPLDELSWREVRQIVHEELERLPESYRLPVILCYLEGRTQEQAAQQLGCPAATIKGRLDRGRDMLERRLTRRGLALAMPVIASCLLPGPAVAGLVQATARSAVRLLAGQALDEGIISTQAAALAKMGLGGTFMKTLKFGGMMVAVLGIIATGVGLAGYLTETLKPAKTLKTEVRTPLQKNERKQIGAMLQNTPLPLLKGDALPVSALARLGSAGFRHELNIHRQGLKYSADNKILAAFSKEGVVIIWDTETGDELRRFHTEVSCSTMDWPAIDLSPDGKALAICDVDITIFDVANGNQLIKVDRPEGIESPKAPWDQQIRFSPDGNTVVAYLEGGVDFRCLFFIETGTGTVRKRVFHVSPMSQMAFSSDSETLAFFCHDSKTMRDWFSFYDVATGGLLRELTPSIVASSYHSPLAFSPDGRCLAFEHYDHKNSNSSIILCDVATGKARTTFETKDARGIGTLAFTPDGRTLIACQLGCLGDYDDYQFKGTPQNPWVKIGAKNARKRDFQGMAQVSNGGEVEAPGSLSHQGPDAPLAHRRAGYPLSGCVPAEPESVSPATWEFSE